MNARMSAAFFAAILLGVPAAADDTVAVVGHGEVKARPDRLVLSFKVTAKSEKASVAITELKGKVQKLRESLQSAATEHKLESASVADTGTTFQPPGGQEEVVFVNGGANVDAEAEIGVESTVTMTLPGVDKMNEEDICEVVAALVDGAVAAGGAYASPGSINPYTGEEAGSGSVMFSFSDLEASREKAWDAAIADARARAAMLAKKMGKELGDVATIEEGKGEGANGDNGNTPQAEHAFAGATEATLTADVKVTFRLK